MGKKSKGRKASNKGKRGGVGGGGSAKNASSSSSSDPSTCIKGKVPDFGSSSSSTSRIPNRGNYPTLYARYKSATRQFLDYMRTNVPNEIVGADGENVPVNFLLAAADWMHVHNHAVDPAVLRSLKLCIRMRRRVADSIFGGGDSGHRYFLEACVFCWTVLRLLPVAEITSANTAEQTSRKESAEEEENNMHNANRFSAFDVEGEEEEEEEDTDMFPTMAPRPQPAAANPMTVADLLNSDDRNDAILFLLTLDEIMGLVAGQYRVLVQNATRHKRPDTALIENLLDATIAANFALQSVQQLEMELQAQHEHLTTPCRLLATLALPEITANVDAIVRQHGSKSCIKRSEIIAFLGDCMQCSFHNQSDSWNRKDSILSEFVAQHEVNATGSAELEQIFQGVMRITVLEIPIKPDVGVEKMRQELVRKTGKPHNSHSWLSRMNYIAGDRSIHHTVRILQLFAGVIDSCPTDKKLLMDPRRRGMFGNPNLPGRLTKIRDMDELLMSRLLPDWTNMCRHGIMGKIKLPRDSELCPFFVQLKSYVDNPRKPVTWSLAFGVHVALTSMLEVNHALPEIVGTSKLVFDNYFAQATNAAKLSLNEKSSNINSSAVWKHNLGMISFLENFGLPVYDDLSLWNPLCAGTSISVLNFFGNIEGGCAIIDCQAQLRIVMYLYHGLIINGIIDEEDIPFLQILYNGFKKCKALWQGSLPKRGELVKMFWISFGLGLSDSKKMSENALLLARGGRLPPDGLFAQGVRLCRGRRMQPIEPAEISTSFRRVCERDFHDVVDKYHTPEQKKNTRGMEQYTVAVHTNDTLDHLEDEIQLHAVNFIPTAYYLEQFVCSITRVLGWEDLLKSFKRDNNTDMRQGFAILFAQHLLGALDFAANPLNHTFQNVPGFIALSPCPNIVAFTSSFLESFFGKIPPPNVMWFQAVDSGDGTKVAVVK
mmetsp:Transcript_1993/g.4320  ORF Transcript_1993/g.4320 Transcript_1993/m.4320 type:complete len:940 (+) Transcript_1993:98-2917(+)